MKPKYKVGDIVTIKQRVGSHDDYRFGFIDEMAAERGKQFVISSVSLADCPGKAVPDDGYYYRLRGVAYTWASSMFEDSPVISPFPISESTDDDDSIEAFIKRNTCPVLDFKL